MDAPDAQGGAWGGATAQHQRSPSACGRVGVCGIPGLSSPKVDLVEAAVCVSCFLT